MNGNESSQYFNAPVGSKQTVISQKTISLMLNANVENQVLYNKFSLHVNINDDFTQYIKSWKISL